jgi:hypothetical protein
MGGIRRLSNKQNKDIKMPLEIIEAKTGTLEPIKIEYEIPATIAECVSLWNEESVYSRFKAQLIIDIQAIMRGYMKDEERSWSVEEIQKEISEWKPSVKAKGKSASEKVRDLFGKLSVDDRKALLEELGLS